MSVQLARRALSAAIVLLMLYNPPLAFARGSQISHDDPWNSERIDQLPPEVRSAVIRMCGHLPRAAHYFATYINSSRVIKLHFEHLQCDDQQWRWLPPPGIRLYRRPLSGISTCETELAG
jgi:hypothetical protein